MSLFKDLKISFLSLVSGSIIKSLSLFNSPRLLILMIQNIAILNQQVL